MAVWRAGIVGLCLAGCPGASSRPGVPRPDAGESDRGGSAHSGVGAWPARADLVPLADDGGVRVEWRSFDTSGCEVQRGCAGPGERALLRFGFRVANVGGAAVDLTPPKGEALAEACSGQPRTTLRRFADWTLRSQEQPVAAGSSDVHCLADDEPLGSGAGGPPLYTCSAQGLSSGFSSRQPHDGVCSFPDVSGLSPGVYGLQVRINAVGQLDEERTDNNLLELKVELPDTRCRGARCGAACCPPNTPCAAAGGCALPDLTVDAPLLERTAQLSLENVGPYDCAVQERCVGGPGHRLLLRFSMRTPNVGEGDLYIGDPAANPRARWSPCHRHYHYEDFAEYRLLTADGRRVVAGHKQAFCAYDGDAFWPDAGPAKYTCMNQGISVGWSDTYHRSLECQWVDVTHVPAGGYLLEAVVNPRRVLAERDYGNNAVRVPVVIPP